MVSTTQHDSSALQLGPGQSAYAAPWPFRRDRGRSRRSDKKQKNILVLMSNTGGGHKASAEALQAGFKQMYGDKCALACHFTLLGLMISADRCEAGEAL